MGNDAVTTDQENKQTEEPEVTTEEQTESAGTSEGKGGDTTTVAEEEPATDPAPDDARLSRIEEELAKLTSLVGSVVSTFASRAVDDGAVIQDDTTPQSTVEIADGEPESPYDRDYMI